VRELLAKKVYLWNESLGVVDTSDEYLVFDCLTLALCLPGEWLKSVDDVVSIGSY
jgi:hypothetical protein